MEQNLGNLERTLLAPEKLRREKPLWQDILIGFVTILLPMLIVGWMVAGLMEGAGLTRTFGWILTAMVIAVLTPFAVFVARRQTSSLIRDRSYALSFADHKIAEIGCKHAAHPWILSICNSLLSGHALSALDHLKDTSMDNGVACESVNEDTGECSTGAAFATCAGFLSFSLLKSMSD